MVRRTSYMNTWAWYTPFTFDFYGCCCCCSCCLVPLREYSTSPVKSISAKNHSVGEYENHLHVIYKFIHRLWKKNRWCIGFFGILSSSLFVWEEALPHCIYAYHRVVCDSGNEHIFKNGNVKHSHINIVEDNGKKFLHYGEAREICALYICIPCHFKYADPTLGKLMWISWICLSADKMVISIINKTPMARVYRTFVLAYFPPRKT